MNTLNRVRLVVIAALLSGAAAEQLYGLQGEPPKPSEAQPPPAPDADKEPAPKADEKPAEPKGNDGGPGETAPSATITIPPECLDSPGEPDLELGLDKTVPPVSYEDALAMDLGPLPWQRIRQLHRLHEEWEKRVRLSPEQRELLRTRFHQIYATMVHHPDRTGWAGFRYPQLKPEQRSQLEGELSQAEVNGDAKRAEAIRTRIAQGTFGTEKNLASPIEYIALGSKSKLDADQQEVFQQVFDRWQSLEARGPIDPPTRIFLRAMKDPELKLDPVLLEKVEARVLEVTKKLPRSPERRKELTKAAEELKAEFLPELPPEKRAVVESTFAFLVSEREAVDQYTKESFQTRDRSRKRKE